MRYLKNDALLEEQRQLNGMSVAMDRAPLFRAVPDVRPRGFEFLIRPPPKEFQNFVNLLDKLISQNIDASFFGDDVEREKLEPREDGVLVSRSKGTLQLLEEWISKTVHMPDREPIEESLAAFRNVRKLRQRPAHALDDDVFDQEYFVEQRVLMIEAYRGLRNLRLLFSNHPATKMLEIPEWLKKPDIWTR